MPRGTPQQTATANFFMYGDLVEDTLYERAQRVIATREYIDDATGKVRQIIWTDLTQVGGTPLIGRQSGGFRKLN